MRSPMRAIAGLTLAGTLFLAGCSGAPLSTREKGTLGGGALGATQTVVRSTGEGQHALIEISRSLSVAGLEAGRGRGRR